MKTTKSNRRELPHVAGAKAGDAERDRARLAVRAYDQAMAATDTFTEPGYEVVTYLLGAILKGERIVVVRGDDQYQALMAMYDGPLDPDGKLSDVWAYIGVEDQDDAEA